MGNSMVVMTVFEKVAKNVQKLLEAILNWNIKMYFICNMSHVTWVVYYVAILTIVIQNIKFLCVGSLPNI
jgi:hypothetical protein